MYINSTRTTRLIYCSLFYFVDNGIASTEESLRFFSPSPHFSAFDSKLLEHIRTFKLIRSLAN